MNKALYSGMVAVALCVGSSPATTIPGALPRDTLSYSAKLQKISIGISAGEGKRAVTMNGSGAESELESQSGGVLIGYDFASWLTGFTTLGAGRLKGANDGDYADQGFRGSLGLNANLWRTDITYPEFLEGTLSFKMVAEYKQMTSTGTRTDYEWNELTVAWPISFEMFASDDAYQSGQIFSLVLYAGPCLSSVDGTITSGGRDTGFSEADNLGTTVGADLYFSDNFELGLQLQTFEDTEASVGLFYHF